jgi:hypothetical protein
MPKPYDPYIPQGKSELRDYLGLLMLSSPTFVDASGYFPERNISTVFYLEAMDISNRMRAHFEADPDDSNGGSDAGRQLVYQLEDLLKRGRKAS